MNKIKASFVSVDNALNSERANEIAVKIWPYFVGLPALFFFCAFMWELHNPPTPAEHGKRIVGDMVLPDHFRYHDKHGRTYSVGSYAESIGYQCLYLNTDFVECKK